MLYREVYSVKISVYPRIFGGKFLHILTEPVPYTFASVNRRNNEVRTHIAIGTGSVKVWKTRHEISVDICTFYNVK